AAANASGLRPPRSAWPPGFALRAGAWRLASAASQVRRYLSCPECGGALSYLGEDAAEQLELMRSAFRVIRTVREKHACTQC
ncbi:IS66 family transposase zinc-finger binding domain-containing protein, partial [Klebsiella pneumoniae]|uniref:IS66 family transposase zinc-finger binding domain-containing protein n=1 Tax=Klebsiella pneumoniae TaxID=573 RepID=UPI003F4F0937